MESDPLGSDHRWGRLPSQVRHPPEGHRRSGRCGPVPPLGAVEPDGWGGGWRTGGYTEHETPHGPLGHKLELGSHLVRERSDLLLLRARLARYRWGHDPQPHGSGGLARGISGSSDLQGSEAIHVSMMSESVGGMGQWVVFGFQ